MKFSSTNWFRTLVLPDLSDTLVDTKHILVIYWKRPTFFAVVLIGSNPRSSQLAITDGMSIFLLYLSYIFFSLCNKKQPRLYILVQERGGGGWANANEPSMNAYSFATSC